MRFIPTPAEDAGGPNTGSGGRSCDIATTACEKNGKRDVQSFGTSSFPRAMGALARDILHLEISDSYNSRFLGML